jgi:hypothetical protein
MSTPPDFCKFNLTVRVVLCTDFGIFFPVMGARPQIIQAAMAFLYRLVVITYDGDALT